MTEELPDFKDLSESQKNKLIFELSHSADDYVSEEETSKPEIYIPGNHYVEYSDGCQELKVNTHNFVMRILNHFPRNTFYKRDDMPVELIESNGKKIIRPIQKNRMRIIVDSKIDLISSSYNSKKEEIIKTNKYCNKDNAELILSHIPHSESVNRIDILTNYPVYTSKWKLSPPGYHNYIYYDASKELFDVPHKYDRKILDDLLVDFPFAEEFDKINFISLLLTPLIRPAIRGNVPMFLIRSSLPRTGKTKLAENVLGIIYYGDDAPAMQLAGSEDERKKCIFAMLLRGDTICHLDNISDYLDSAVLSSLITAKTIQDRVLGMSKMINVPNTVTLVATGNNPRATSEIVKRTVPITLQPKTDAPELRDDFIHPDLRKYIFANRRRIYGCLIGMVEEWKAAGMPKGKLKMGGFEDWIESVSGIFDVLKIKGFLDNWNEFLQEADPENNELKEFIKEWAEKYYTVPKTTTELLELAEEHELFNDVLAFATSDRGKQTIFGRKVLNKYLKAPVGDWQIMRGQKNTYFLKNNNSTEVPF